MEDNVANFLLELFKISIYLGVFVTGIVLFMNVFHGTVKVLGNLLGGVLVAISKFLG